MTNKLRINLLRTGWFILTVGGLCISSILGQNAARQTIYDGRAVLKESAVSSREQQLVAGEVKRQEALVKQKSSVSCDEAAPGENDSASVVSAASGSITRPKSTQKAILYELCRSGRSFGIGGIMIVENGKVLEHYIYGENGLYNEIQTLPDIDQNGLSEIVLIGSGTGQGYTESGISIIEFSSNSLRFLGTAETYADNFGTGNQPEQATAYKLSVASKAEPVFYRETYRQNGTGKKWLPVGKAQKFTLTKDAEMKYHKIN